MNPPSKTHHRKGLAITLTGGLLLTIDIPLIRLANMEPWTMMLLRSLLLGTAITAYWLIKKALRQPVPPLVNGRYGWIVGAIYGAANITFTLAVFHTATSNLVFILACNAMVAAILSWLLLAERPALATWMTIVITLAGVLLIVRDGIQAGSWLGDSLALATAVGMATALTLTRKSGKDLSMTPAIGGFISVLVALPVVGLGGWTMPTTGLPYLVIDGLIVIPLAAGLLALGPSYISAPEVAMFFLLETVLTPVWVWFIFSEVPTANSLMGGAIVIVAILAHSLWQLWALDRQPQPLGSR